METPGRKHPFFGVLSPQNIHIEITGKCNLQCKYCYNATYNSPVFIKNELSSDQICRIIEQAKKIGIHNFSISGGEPFLKPGLEKIIEACSGCALTIFTSAMYISEKWLNYFNDHPQVKTLKISLDGLESNDRIRIGSKHLVVLENVRKLTHNDGINLEINTVMTSQNIADFLPLYHALKSIPINRWNFDIPTFTSRMREKENLNLFNINFKELIEQLSELIFLHLKEDCEFRLSIRYLYDSSIWGSDALIQAIKEYGDDLLFPPSVHPCIFERVLVIRPDGAITRCSSHNEILNKITEDSDIVNVFTESENNDFMNIKVQDLTNCQNCRYLGICGGGCRANAKYFCGTNFDSDPIACSILPLAEKSLWKRLPADKSVYYYELINSNGNYPVSSDNLLDCLKTP